MAQVAGFELEGAGVAVAYLGHSRFVISFVLFIFKLCHTDSTVNAGDFVLLLCWFRNYFSRLPVLFLKLTELIVASRYCLEAPINFTSIVDFYILLHHKPKIHPHL